MEAYNFSDFSDSLGQYTEDRDYRTLQEKLIDKRKQDNPSSFLGAPTREDLYGVDNSNNDPFSLYKTKDEKEKEKENQLGPRADDPNNFLNTILDTADNAKQIKNTLSTVSNTASIASSTASAAAQASNVASTVASGSAHVAAETGASVAGAGAGAAVAGSALAIAGFGMDAVQAFSTDAGATKKGRTIQTASLAAKGALAGLSVAGPIGAGVGAFAGFMVGSIDGRSDRKKARKKRVKERDDKKAEEERRRLRDYFDARKGKRTDALMAYHNAQLGYINVDNYN